MSEEEKRNLVISFLLAVLVLVDLIMMVIRWDDKWSKVFGGIFNFLFSLTDIIGYVCIVLVVCWVVFVIAALIYEHFYGDEEDEGDEQDDKR